VAATPSVKVREAGTSKPIRRSPRRRLGLSHILVGVVAVLAFVFNFLALQNRDATVMVALADQPIAVGTAMTADLIRLEPISAGFSGIDHLVTEDDLSDLEDAIVGRSVAEGELIDRSALVIGRASDGSRSMSIPVTVEHAAGGALTMGDRVDVISMVSDAPAFVATDLEVIAVAERAQSGLSGSGSYFIVVAVTADEALALADAIDNGSIEVIRSTGATVSGEEG
jgi:Flp pilus assembly protein CpaB